MKDPTYLYRQHLRLRAASDALLVAHYLSGAASRVHLREARREIMKALADTHREARDQCEDGISDAIADSHNGTLDPYEASKAVVEHILDTLAPMPENDDDA
jgi:poly-gamma-glutamate capsule biosynthesis protein CapA/YwtB (metallophosphatase superfamily)